MGNAGNQKPDERAGFQEITEISRIRQNVSGQPSEGMVAAQQLDESIEHSLVPDQALYEPIPGLFSAKPRSKLAGIPGESPRRIIPGRQGSAGMPGSHLPADQGPADTRAGQGADQAYRVADGKKPLPAELRRAKTGMEPGPPGSVHHLILC
jgi:hypothetical protein